MDQYTGEWLPTILAWVSQNLNLGRLFVGSIESWCGGERKKFKKERQQIKDVLEAIYLPQWITKWVWLWAGTLGNGIKHISELLHPRTKGAEVLRHHIRSVIAWRLMGGGEINFLTHSACYEVGRRALISSRNKLFHTQKCGGKSCRVPWNGRVPGISVGSWWYLLYPLPSLHGSKLRG